MSEPDARVLADLLRESMARGEQPALTLTSDSMAPLLKTGDQIRIAAATPAALRPGDIVTFVAAGGSQLMTHRFWGTLQQDGQTALVTRGDRPLQFDAPFAADRLVGHVVARLRHGRELRLDAGAGAWLNSRLTALARHDMARLAGVGPDRLDQMVATAARTPRPAQRLVHRTLFAAAVLLTALVGAVERF